MLTQSDRCTPMRKYVLRPLQSVGRQCCPPLSRAVLSGIAAVIILGFVGYWANGQETPDAYQFSRDAVQGRKIAPVPLDIQGKGRDVVYLGSYLVNARGSCNDCHTCPSYKGIDPYKVGGDALGPANTPGPINTANYLAGGTPFVNGTILSPNLTPDSSGRPGGMTFQAFKAAMQNGQSAHGPGHILQVMPWPTFRHMYDNDLVAIYQYLSALPPAQPGKCTASAQTGS